MANNDYRIKIPTNPTEAIKLLSAIKKKHEELGTASPLAGLKWTPISAALEKADTQDELSDELHKQAQKATGARDVEMPAVMDAIRSSRDVLMGLNRDNPDALGDFGFSVADAHADSAPAKPPVA